MQPVHQAHQQKCWLRGGEDVGVLFFIVFFIVFFIAARRGDGVGAVARRVRDGARADVAPRREPFVAGSHEKRQHER